MNNKYFLNTGEADRQRLTILNRLYNPPALTFLKNAGLQTGMTVLEIGCGTGHMACQLAEYLGPAGKVIAIDSSDKQIAVAKNTAELAGIDNIEFHVCDVFDIAKLGINYDATYGRWVIEFTQQPEKALALMYQYLNRGGILAYEATNMEQTAYFSYPYEPALERWHAISPKIFSSFTCKFNFSYEVFNVFKRLNCNDIEMRVSQAILTTAEEKSVYRLGLISIKQSLLEKNIMSAAEIENLIFELSFLEQRDGITGFFRNILISGRK